MGGGAVITICHENHILHLRAGASQSRDSASQSRDKIPTSLALVFCTIHPLYPTPNLYKSSRLSLAAAIGCPDCTCISFFTIPRLYPTPNLYKSSRLSLATAYGPPLQCVFTIQHHKSPIQPDYQLQSYLMTVLFRIFITHHHTGRYVFSKCQTGPPRPPINSLNCQTGPLLKSSS